MGIYLPMALTLLVPVGAFIGWLYDRWAERQRDNPEFAKRMGVLAATGLIVGESLFGVAFAGIVAARARTPRWRSSVTASRPSLITSACPQFAAYRAYAWVVVLVLPEAGGQTGASARFRHERVADVAQRPHLLPGVRASNSSERTSSTCPGTAGRAGPSPPR